MPQITEQFRTLLNLPEFPGIHSDGKIYGSHNKSISYVYGENPTYTMWKKLAFAMFEIPMASYVQIGERFYIDATLQQRLENLNLSKVQYYNLRYCDLPFEGHMGYTAVTLAAMQDLPQAFNGTKVLDIGTNDGILGVTALKLGARNVRGIDKRDCSAAIIEACSINNLPNSLFSFQQEDVSTLISQPPSDVDVVLANIGPHVYLYGDTYLKVLQVAKQIESVRVCILGGYFDAPKPYIFLEKIRNILMRAGFKNYREYYTKVSVPEGKHEGKNREVTIVVERD